MYEGYFETDEPLLAQLTGSAKRIAVSGKRDKDLSCGSSVSLSHLPGLTVIITGKPEPSPVSVAGVEVQYAHV